MLPQISPERLFLVQRYLDESSASTAERRMDNDSLRKLFNEVSDSIKDLISYGYSLSFSKFGGIYSEAGSGGPGLIKKIVDKEPELIQEALNLYKSNSEEEIYLSLLNKQLQQMTGHEIKVLINYVIKY